MEYIVLGQTNLMISKESFDVDSLVCSDDEKQKILNYAYNSGINFYVCNSKQFEVLADAQSNSSESSLHLLGKVFNDKRNSVFLGVKFNSQKLEDLRNSIETSLKSLQSDYLDICILEYDDFIPLPGADDGIYDYLITAKAEGKIKQIGIMCDDIEKIKSNLDTQLFSVVFTTYGIKNSNEKNQLVQQCTNDNIGFVALSNDEETKESLPLLFGFIHSNETIITLWKMPTMEDVQKIVYFETHPPIIDDRFKQEIENLKNSNI